MWASATILARCPNLALRDFKTTNQFSRKMVAANLKISKIGIGLPLNIWKRGCMSDSRAESKRAHIVSLLDEFGIKSLDIRTNFNEHEELSRFINTCVDRGEYMKAELAYSLVQEDPNLLDICFSYACVLAMMRCFAKQGKVNSIMNLLKNSEVNILDEPMCKELIYGLATARLTAQMETVFHQLMKAKEWNGIKVRCSPTAALYNEVLRGYMLAGDMSKMLFWFQNLQNVAPPNLESYHIMLNAMSKQPGYLSQMRQLFDEMVTTKIAPTADTFTFLILALFRQGQIQEGLGQLEKMKDFQVVPDIGTYNTLMKELISSSHTDEVVSLAHQLKKHGVKPNVKTYKLLVKLLVDHKISVDV